MTKEMWQIIASEMRDLKLTSQLRKFGDRAFQLGAEFVASNCRGDTLVGDAVSLWLSEHNLDKELTGLASIIDKLPEDEKKHIVSALTLYSGIKAAIQVADAKKAEASHEEE